MKIAREWTIGAGVLLMLAGTVSASDFSSWQNKLPITFTGDNPPGGATTLAGVVNTWTGGGTSSNASEAANWSDGVPIQGNTIVLNGTTNKPMTWNAGSNGLPDSVAAWEQTASYSGTVTFATLYGTTGFTNFTVSGDVILAGGTWTHLANSGAEINRLSVSIGGNLLVSNATIRADELGYNTAAPGSGSGATGGAYGGAGGGQYYIPNQNVYGAITAPVNLGSRGGNTGATGGGGILLTVTGTTTLEAGSILTANGAYGVAVGGGSGGSIFLTTGWLTGSGILRANGANSSHYGGGSGGRVAVVLTGTGADFSAWTGTNTAFGGPAQLPAAAGTIYQCEADGTDSLIIDNNNKFAHGQFSTLIPSGTPSLNSFSNVIIRDKGVLGVQDDTMVDFNTFAPTVEGADNSYLALDSDSNTTYPSDWTITGYTLYPQGITKPLTNVTVGTDGVLSHYKNYDSEIYRVALTLNGNLTIETNGAINVNGLGYDPGRGPGRSTSGGAGYGGMGGGPGGATYGSVFAPTNLGSGSSAFYSGWGGGAVILNVDGAFTNHGTISAIGTSGNYNGGSGGSVFITAGVIAGDATGVISANGRGAQRCGGGGGRVAVVLTGTGADFGSYAGGMTALGGSGGSGATYGPGAAGTVYLAPAGTAYGAGTVWVTNTVTTSNTVITPVPADLNTTEDLRASTWLVGGTARLGVSTNVATAQIGYLTVTGSSVRIDLQGRTLSVLPKLNVNGTLYEVGSYATNDFSGGIVSDSAGGGHMEVRPELDNADGATAVSETAATLNGDLYAADATSTALFVLWGANDGGTHLSEWAHTNLWPAPQSAGFFSTNLAPPELLANTVHYYRFYVTNSLRKSIASSSSTFMTADVSVEATANAAEAGLIPGAFTFYRHSDATNGAITVGFAISGSAGPDTNYVNNLGTTITFAAGASQTNLTVTPIQDDNSQSNETLILTLAAGPYPLGTPACVTALVENASLPTAPTNVWLGGGNASEGTNWSLGHAPTNTETVFLSGFSKAAMVWDVTNTVASWQQTDQYTGTVTLATVFPGNGDFTNLHVLGDAAFLGGTWTHLANSGAELNRMCMLIGGNLTIGSGVTLTADELGYNTAAPGSGASGTGGAYGGAGGGQKYVPNRNVYGSITAPVNLGSRGGSSAAKGGGAILLTVTGTTTLEAGSILTANGAYGTFGAGGGSGGSIFLTTGWLTGSGVLRANGANSSHYGGGSGGRVAIVLNGPGADFSAWNGTNTAFGAAPLRAAAGTVYQRAADGTDSLIIDNNNAFAQGQFSTLIPSNTPSLNSFSNVIIRGKGVLGVQDDTIVDFNTFAPTVEGASNSYLALDDDSNTTYPSDWTIAGYTLYPKGITKPLENVTIGANGMLSHYKNYSSEVYRVALTLSGNLTIETNGAINVDGLGFDPAFGPGQSSSGAAGHGGMGGGLGGGATYGSVFAPTNLGSGSTATYSGWGGGCVILNMAGALTNNGTISADGTSGTYHCGSGGSVFITAGSIAGDTTGVINANGRRGNFCGGGGGRVAVVLTGTGADFGSYAGEITTGGGSGASGTTYGSGAAGTVYRAPGGTAYGAGAVTVDNNNLVTSNTTFTCVPTFMNATENLDRSLWIGQNKARIATITNTTLMSLMLNTNSYLDLTGNTLTVEMLTITNMAYDIGTYSAGQLGALVSDDPGGGSVVVLGYFPASVFIIR